MNRSEIFKVGAVLLLLGIVLNIIMYYGIYQMTLDWQQFMEEGLPGDEILVQLESKKSLLLILEYISWALILTGLFMGLFSFIKVKKEANLLNDGTPLDQI